MPDKEGDGKFDQAFQLPDGRIVRINSKENTCKTEKPPACYYPYYVAPQPMTQHLMMQHPMTQHPMMQHPMTQHPMMQHPMTQHPTVHYMPYPGPYSVWPIPPNSSSDCSEENLWDEYKNDNGRTYYYNKETKKSQWNKPDNIEEKMKKKDPERPKPPKLPKKYSNKSEGFLCQGS